MPTHARGGAGLSETEFAAIRSEFDEFHIARSNYADCLHLSPHCSGLKDIDTVTKPVAVYPYGSKPVCSLCWEAATNGKLHGENGDYLPALEV